MRLGMFPIVLLLLLVMLNTFAQNQSDNLEYLIGRAIAESPKIKMLESKLNSAEQRIPQNSNLPDPEVVLGLVNLPVNSFSFSQEPMTGKMISLSQAFPFPGKLNAAGEVFSVDKELVKLEIEEERNRLRKEVSSLYYDLTFARKAESITDENKTLLESVAEVVNTKYTVSKASQQNVIKNEFQITKLEDKLTDLRAKEKQILAELKELTLLSEDSNFATPATNELPGSSFTTNELIMLAKENRPLLKQTELLETKSDRMADLADYDNYPNFKVTLQYNQRDEIAKTNTDLKDFLSLMVGFSVPLNYGGKTDAKVEEALSMKEMYSRQYLSNLQLLKISVETSLEKLASLKNRSQLNEQGLLIQAEQNYSSSLSGYQVGEVEFLNVVDAVDMVLQVELNIVKIKTDYLKEISDLEFLIGTKLK